MKSSKSQKGTSRRFSEVLSETLWRQIFLSETLGPVAPNRVAPYLVNLFLTN